MKFPIQTPLAAAILSPLVYLYAQNSGWTATVLAFGFGLIISAGVVRIVIWTAQNDASARPPFSLSFSGLQTIAQNAEISIALVRTMCECLSIEARPSKPSEERKK